MYLIRFSKAAEKDKEYLKAAKLDRKTRELLSIIQADPFRKPPAFECLVGNLTGLYSRRINIQHRLVYEVFNDPVLYNEIQYDGTIRIVRMRLHYE